MYKSSKKKLHVEIEKVVPTLNEILEMSDRDIAATPDEIRQHSSTSNLISIYEKYQQAFQSSNNRMSDIEKLVTFR